jgi:hypothetical protein
MTTATEMHVDNFPVRVDKASVCDGRGLFATRAVPKGSVLTTYPCDVVIFKRKGSGVEEVGFIKSPALRDMDGAYRFTDKNAEYTHTISTEKGTFHLFAGRDRTFEPAACAHLINDSHPDVARIKRFPRDTAQIVNAMSDYLLRVRGRANCTLRQRQDSYVVAVATRDIAEGEELLTRYDYPFWSGIDFDNKTGDDIAAHILTLPDRQAEFHKMLLRENRDDYE